MGVQCFFAEPADTAEESLRRYASSEETSKCPGKFGYHNAGAQIGVVPYPIGDSDGTAGDDFPRDDPRWPRACPCGYVFAATDHWQHNVTRQYVRADTGERFVLGQAPAGAMWFADWMGKEYAGPDGHCLCVKLPDGRDWLVDGPSRNADGSRGAAWTRNGTPPNITARPSILTPEYHGFLTNGVLQPC